ncbi:MAG: DUF3810 domain-containing protein [Lachnospiraceae bacterium]|nr:DUF3810 domain-containing protein [Lachnospiraceae bacterium]
MKNKDKKFRMKTSTKVCAGIIVCITFFNVLSIFSTTFAEWYRKYFFSKFSLFFSRISGFVTISVGEVMICLGICLLFLCITIGLLGFLKSSLLKKVRRIYFRSILYVCIFIYAAETFHCFILYHTKPLEDKLYTDSISTEPDIERLLMVYNEVTGKMNELSKKVRRDENGDLLNDFTYEECKTALRNVSDIFEYLNGYYPNPKKIYYSDIMSQQYLAGIYFPFSMEANYNKLMYCSNYPSTICHELSHLKGYIREDEANFVAYIACIHSENDFIRYSGYLGVYYYLLNDILQYGNDDVYSRMEEPNEYAVADNIFLKREVFEEIEENAIISTEVLSDATDKFIDSNLKLNGVKSGMNNYNEVVRLLILYYDSQKES